MAAAKRLFLLGLQMEGTVFAPSLQGMKHVKSDSGVILTKAFLEVCKHILPVLGKEFLHPCDCEKLFR
jgi:hypothetical protein